MFLLKFTKNIAIAFIVASAFQILLQVQCRDRCWIAKALYYRFRVSKSIIPSLLCYMEHSSEFETTKFTKNGEERRYGIFQLKGGEVCAEKDEDLENSLCSIPCASLTDDQLGDDVRCWRKIYSKYGFAYWPEWVENCKGQFLVKYLQGCPLH